MGISRRKFLKVTSGIVGGGVAAELGILNVDTAAAAAKAGKVPIKSGRQIPSICPYCAVGCGQIVTVDDAGVIVDIQGNPDSPINQGTLCPKGAATLQLVKNEQRWNTVKYRAPGSDRWEEKPLDWAMSRIAELTKKTRDANFNEFQDMPDGKGGTARKRVMNTYAIASLGGATMDNEWNYLHQKLMHALGVVYLENQARI
ncbi:formate dehydrogenase [Geomonas terrae]|uniref:Formate dehydrogenase n=3 Tax=Geomonas terrae TaxID=2562681 RepID=A0A4S1CMM3_9BACT|nr:formate dehydrogenase [Geomonas terrae]TGU75078.1 formate dehydrogenase [Geomonas terrae]